MSPEAVALLSLIQAQIPQADLEKELRKLLHLRPHPACEISENLEHTEFQCVKEAMLTLLFSNDASWTDVERSCLMLALDEYFKDRPVLPVVAELDRFRLFFMDKHKSDPGVLFNCNETPTKPESTGILPIVIPKPRHVVVARATQLASETEGTRQL